jgi:hypothetical protein
MRYIAILTLLFVVQVATAKFNPADYFAFDKTKQLIYEIKFRAGKQDEELFRYNKNCEMSIDSIDIDSGVYYLYNNCNASMGKRYRAAIDTRKNYEIVVRAKMRYYEKRYYLRYGFIMWNFTGSQQYNIFSFSGDKRYFFHTHLDTATKADLCLGGERIRVKRYYYNKFVRYTIRRYDDKYYFYMNGILIHTGVSMYDKVPVNTSDIAIGAYGNAHVEFKDVSVYYLPGEKNP